RHTRFKCDWSSDVCSSDLLFLISSAFASLNAFLGPRPTIPSSENMPGGRSFLSSSKCLTWPVLKSSSKCCLIEEPKPGTESSLRSEERRVGKECRVNMEQA